MSQLSWHVGTLFRSLIFQTSLQSTLSKPPLALLKIVEKYWEPSIKIWSSRYIQLNLSLSWLGINLSITSACAFLVFFKAEAISGGIHTHHPFVEAGYHFNSDHATHFQLNRSYVEWFNPEYAFTSTFDWTFYILTWIKALTTLVTIISRQDLVEISILPDWRQLWQGFQWPTHAEVYLSVPEPHRRRSRPWPNLSRPHRRRRQGLSRLKEQKIIGTHVWLVQ